MRGIIARCGPASPGRIRTEVVISALMMNDVSTAQRVMDPLLATTVAAKGGYLDRLVFKARGRIVFLRTEEVHWIAAEENYVRLATATENHMVRHTISHMEERLDPRKFLRIHRSTIVNLAFVKEIRTDAGGGSYVAVMVSGQKLAISRGYRTRILEMLMA